jgi:hypothetical protein
MPQLVRGGKWVFGWVVVGPEGAVPIPPEAWQEYGFEVGEEAFFMPGSRTSGGFGVSTSRLMDHGLALMAGRFRGRAVARGRFQEKGRLTLPPEVGANPGDRLLVVRGSGRALGFVARGPIYETATKHSNIEEYG